MLLQFCSKFSSHIFSNLTHETFPSNLRKLLKHKTYRPIDISSSEPFSRNSKSSQACSCCLKCSESFSSSFEKSQELNFLKNLNLNISTLSIENLKLNWEHQNDLKLPGMFNYEIASDECKTVRYFKGKELQWQQALHHVLQWYEKNYNYSQNLERTHGFHFDKGSFRFAHLKQRHA